ncbi:MAG: ABC transporter permease [Roseivirga sp.]|jgi:ABC-type antimicrobial peptide transport system permease subunit|uniref:FtsX-like permease family protein n=1 Tax=Roseivirga sp. TaxID=1964215 RepID=UPI001B1D6721|nr:FtsX-like permease family protein [Roseivirga sp.]MBO6497008.1 ABC transporter permease [Roseivirga sp.]
MLKNYFITALRNLSRNRSFTIINIFGLALGISAALVLFKIVIFEKSFDTYLTNYDNLYRFTKKVISPNLVEQEAGMQNPFAEAFKTDYPDLGTPVRTFYIGENQLSVQNVTGDWTHYEQRDGISFVDEEFFELFDYEWKVGDPETALSKPKSAVISISLAEKYFGVTDGGYDRVLGKEMKLNNDLTIFITGVVSDPPKNASLPFKLLIEYESVAEIFDFFQPDSWGSTSSNAHVYFLANDNVTAQQIRDVLPAMSEKYMPETENETVFQLQALADMHFQPEYNVYGNSAKSPDFLTVPIAIGVFLILTACINFVNLSTALAIKRSKEVGIRKVLGGVRNQLVFQFMGETFLITVIATLISLGVAELAMTNMEELIGYSLSLELMKDTSLLLVALGVVVGVTLLAGLYPSFILSRLKPVAVLRSKGQSSLSGNINTRRGLVVFQFLISQVLVICTLVVISQMKFFENKDLGFRKSSIITFPLPSNEEAKLNFMGNELQTFPGVEKVSFSFASPLSDNNIGSTFGYAPLETTGEFDAAYKVIDENYLDLYDIKLLAGSDISKFDTTLSEAIISEQALKLMGLENPEDAIGETIRSGFNGDKRVVGVFKDFHNKDLRDKVDPIIMVRYAGYYYEGAVRFEGSESQTSNLVKKLEETWTAQYPDTIFDYTLLSEKIMENYEEEARVLTLFQIFSGLAIFIGCLGLYGLVSFMANQKTKEIGIRKVLGASVNQILNLFSKELLVLIGIAFLLAAPLGYYLMNDWLSGFEFRIGLSVWVFAAAIGFTLLIGAITTGLRSFRAATSNPVDSLRSE